MKFQKIAITPPYFYEGEADRIADALAGGFDRVHIRKPGSSAEDFERLLAAIPADLLPRISIHDHFPLAEKYPVGGLHLNSRNPFRHEGAWKGLISISTHNPREAVIESACGCDYVFLSPIFPSFSKPGYGPRKVYEEYLCEIDEAVIALGGVTYDSLPALKAAGFGGAAMLTEAWRHPLDMDAFRLQFITHPQADRSVVEGVRLALEGGCRWIQLRHKDASEQTLTQEGLAISEMCRACGATFIIDDHVELVKATGADGVHLGKNDMPVEEARRKLGPSYIIGATANTYEELSAAARAGADYAGVGPYRFTTTKDKLAPILGTEGYRHICSRRNHEHIRIPITAIGGITEQDIPEITATGVEGIAASGCILNAGDPAHATSRIARQIRTNIELNQK